MNDAPECDAMAEISSGSPIEIETTDSQSVAEPEATTFWSLYSPRFEMPISHIVAAILIVGCLGLFSFIRYLENSSYPQKPGPKIGTVDGPDETGDGAEGAGGVEDPIAQGSNTPTAEDIKNILPNPDVQLPEVKEDLSKRMQLDDPNAAVNITSNNATALAALDKTLQDKLLGIGQKKGSGGPGTEGENEKGTGKGGTGSDSTRSRSLRWVLVFKTNGGRDYVDQLDALGAVIFVPIENNKTMYFPNLKNPVPGVYAAEADWNKHISQMQFHDFNRKSCDEVGEALGLKFTPKSFVAFFPKKFEDDLAKKEVGYQQRRSTDVEETKFEILRRGGSYEVTVVSQRMKK